jgi:hypothetical protein
MRTIDIAKQAVRTAMSQFGTMHQEPHFYCGQCERWERCGRPPSDDCITMLAQIARSRGKSDLNPRWWRASLGA